MKRADAPFSVYEIVPGALFQRGKTHDLPRERKVRGLVQLGITHAVALAPPRPDPDLVTLDDLGIVAYTHFPIPDGLLKTSDLLLEMAERLTEEVEAGGRLLIMCNAGRNRSALLSALVVRRLQGISGAAAIEHLQRERPNALANLNFTAWLTELP